MFESTTPQPPKFRPSFRFPTLTIRGGRFGRFIFRLALLIVPLLFFRACFLTYVPPARMGLRQFSFGPGSGPQKHLVPPRDRPPLSFHRPVTTVPRDDQ